MHVPKTPNTLSCRYDTVAMPLAKTLNQNSADDDDDDKLMIAM